MITRLACVTRSGAAERAAAEDYTRLKRLMIETTLAADAVNHIHKEPLLKKTFVPERRDRCSRNVRER